jgi:hypothetical protein
MTESEVFEAVTNGGSSDFAVLIDILNRHGSWCLIGGLAVNCYVEPVYTLDADVVVVASKLSMIRRDLIEAKFLVEEFEHSLNARMSGSDLRIQLSLDPRYQSFLANARPMKVLGHDVPVASLTDIVRGKVWAWGDVKRRTTKRKKDELDLMRILEAYPETRALMPEQIKAQVPE